MANILLKTEALDDVTEWTQSDFLTVTADSAAGPAYLGIHAGMADTLVDANTSNQCGLDGAFKTITSDGTSWTASVHIKKDAVTDRFALLELNFENGTAMTVGISLDTKNGTVSAASGITAPDASGVEDKTDYWRFWLTHANNNTGNNAIRVRYKPAQASVLGAAGDNAVTGSTVTFGFNLTNTATVQPYEPDPTYAIEFPASGGGGGALIQIPPPDSDDNESICAVQIL